MKFISKFMMIKLRLVLSITEAIRPIYRKTSSYLNDLHMRIKIEFSTSLCFQTFHKWPMNEGQATKSKRKWGALKLLPFVINYHTVQFYNKIQASSFCLVSLLFDARTQKSAY
ncbi:CLUMA_CG015949, isoform A [Clunio marinus]|uniref:CLUMA_CG015949, isoform A n=1 Tax=Clunio marinus TaxID=568069 RepID=A0A1J1IRE6_9DIPT|nr:CLUMA_CG015949, isoform A [Clunio marinus]